MTKVGYKGNLDYSVEVWHTSKNGFDYFVEKLK